VPFCRGLFVGPCSSSSSAPFSLEGREGLFDLWRKGRISFSTVSLLSVCLSQQMALMCA